MGNVKSVSLLNFRPKMVSYSYEEYYRNGAIYRRMVHKKSNLINAIKAGLKGKRNR